jgi:hypothetical protein
MIAAGVQGAVVSRVSLDLSGVVGEIDGIQVNRMNPVVGEIAVNNNDADRG